MSGSTPPPSAYSYYFPVRCLQIRIILFNFGAKNKKQEKTSNMRPTNKSKLPPSLPRSGKGWLQEGREPTLLDGPPAQCIWRGACRYISFENQVKLSNTSFIDGYIEETHVLIDQKSLDKDLRKPIKLNFFKSFRNTVLASVSETK